MSLLTSRISLYPNPTAGNVTVSIEGADVRELQLLDLYGRVVLRLSLSAQRAVTLDLSALPQGVYILRAGATARRIIKK